MRVSLFLLVLLVLPAGCVGPVYEESVKVCNPTFWGPGSTGAAQSSRLTCADGGPAESRASINGCDPGEDASLSYANEAVGGVAKVVVESSDGDVVYYSESVSEGETGEDIRIPIASEVYLVASVGAEQDGVFWAELRCMAS